MKYVIDIDENYIKDFKLQVDLIGKDLMESPSGMTKYAIANGTPLQEERKVAYNDGFIDAWKMRNKDFKTELEEIKDKIMWEANGQFCARIVSGRVIDILDERIKELNIEKEKGKCSMCDKEAIAYLIYAKKFVCVDCIDKLLHYCCVGENKQ